LPKPFELAILIARLESLLRRSAWLKDRDRAGAGKGDGHDDDNDLDKTRRAPEGGQGTGGDIFSFGGKTIDFEELELRTLGNTIHLTVMEAELLRYLVKSEGRVVSRKAILEDVWGLHEDTDTRAIDNFVVRLRRYIEEDPSQPKHLQTVRGVGYRFVAEPE
jgi:DNA-binding response OmpR family regulator